MNRRRPAGAVLSAGCRNSRIRVPRGFRPEPCCDDVGNEELRIIQALEEAMATAKLKAEQGS